MSRKRSPEAQKRRDEFQELLRSRVAERGITEDVPLRGIGIRRLQLVRMPSFSLGNSWDIRERDDRWRVFRADIPHDLHRACGYTELMADSNELRSWFERVCSISIPLRPSLTGMGGYDGTTYQLSVFGDLHSSFGCQWWSEPPSQWKPLVRIANEMLTYFDSLSPRQNRQETRSAD